MRSLLVLVLAVGLVAAEIGLGYNYKPPPFVTYGVPSYQGSASSGQYNVDYGNGLNYKVTAQNQGSGYHGLGYQGPVYQGSNLAFQNAASNVYKVNGGYQVLRPASSYETNYQGIYNNGNAHRESVQYQGQHFGSYAHQNEFNKVHTYPNLYQLSSQQPQIYKHFYFHAAPEDEATPKPRTPIVLPPPQKHYKIIFIKAPTQVASAPQVIPVPQQNEEKTLVYVLVNKPEDAPNVVLPKVEQKPPAKPEVFFIKYNNKDGSQAVIDNIVKDHNNGQSIGFTNVGSSAPVSSLLLGTYGGQNAQGGSSVSVGGPVPEIVSNAGFGAVNTQSESSFVSKPLALGSSGISDGTLASTFVGTGTTATSNVDNAFSSASSGPGFNGVSSTAGFNTLSGGENNIATSSTGFNSASSSTGLPGVSSIVLNNGNSGLNGVSSSIGYSSGVSSIATVSPLPDSEFNGSTISTSQGVPHDSYGVPKFRE